MAKLKTVYFCSNCGNESPKWMGKCPACGEWGSLVEEVIRKDAASKREDTRSFDLGKSIAQPIGEIRADEEPRIDMLDGELNRVLGGGLVPASLVLIGGEPGIGKSTLVLQTMLKLSNIKTLYVSGEESARQIKLRADRIGILNDNSLILCETNLDQIFTHVKNSNPDLVIIDSIQTVYSDMLESSPGSSSKTRHTARLKDHVQPSAAPAQIQGRFAEDLAKKNPSRLGSGFRFFSPWALYLRLAEA